MNHREKDTAKQQTFIWDLGRLEKNLSFSDITLRALGLAKRGCTGAQGPTPLILIYVWVLFCKHVHWAWGGPFIWWTRGTAARFLTAPHIVWMHKQLWTQGRCIPVLSLNNVLKRAMVSLAQNSERILSAFEIAVIITIQMNVIMQNPEKKTLSTSRTHFSSCW